MAKLPTFTMEFQPATIKHLGLRLYSTLPPVIGELVSNAYDAESPKVEILIPEGEIMPTSEVIVRDYGHGMNPDELQEEYLPVGRNRRGLDNSKVMSKNGKVRVTGRKGLGKLSGFGVASEMDITAFKEGFSVCLRLNYDDMEAWANRRKTPYAPKVIQTKTGKANEPNGLEIRLRKFHRRRRIPPELLRKGLAKRLTFIGKGFEVLVNGEPIQPGDRVQREQCAPGYHWDVSEIPIKIEGGAAFAVTGWVGFLKESSQTDRGIDIFANKKAVELGSFFNLSSTHAQFARAHLIGEIHADFLDANDDLIATARNSVVWESDIGQKLEVWGQDILKWAFVRWLAQRRKEKEEQIIAVAGFDDWLVTRMPQEQKIAQRMVKLLVEDDKMESESIKPILEIIKSSVETVHFHELVEVIEKASPAAIIELFRDWRLIEARELLKMADGRREAIDKLEQYMDEGAHEVKTLQPLFNQNLWLINPGWTEAHIQPTYTKLLRENCREPKEYKDKDRRLDILGVSVGAQMTVVELKHPKKALTRKDLEQIERYVDWARNQFMGTAPDSPKYIDGLLVVGEMSHLGDIQSKVVRLAGDDIRVEPYCDLHEKSRRFYDEVDKHLQKIAPEYSRTRRKQLQEKG